MSQPLNVKVSSRYQIAVPRIVRERLIVDIQDGLLILIPQPEDYAAKTAGLHHEVWEGLDTTVYLREERGTWRYGIHHERQPGSAGGSAGCVDIAKVTGSSPVPPI